MPDARKTTPTAKVGVVQTLLGPDVAAEAATGLLACCRSEAFHQLRLAIRGLILVDDSLGRSLIKTLQSHTKRFGAVVGSGGLEGALHTGLELTADGLVSFLGLRVGEDALLLALNVGHGAGTSLLPAARQGGHNEQ